MNTRPTQSQESLIEKYRVALDNAQKHPQIAPIMAEFGYNADKIAQGEALWQDIYTKYNDNIAKTHQKDKTYSRFNAQRTELELLYRNHRKKAKVIFSKKPLLLIDLDIKGTVPTSYAKWLELIKRFYTTAQTNTEVKQGLEAIKITEEILIDAQQRINVLQEIRSDYLKTKANSQDATKVKDKALTTLISWMKDFYAIAEIALEEHPQLMEALSKVVKS